MSSAPRGTARTSSTSPTANRPTSSTSLPMASLNCSVTPTASLDTPRSTGRNRRTVRSQRRAFAPSRPRLLRATRRSSSTPTGMAPATSIAMVAPTSSRALVGTSNPPMFRKIQTGSFMARTSAKAARRCTRSMSMAMVATMSSPASRRTATVSRGSSRTSTALSPSA